MTTLDDAMERLEAAIERLEQAAGKLPPRLKGESSVLSQTAAQVAARLDAAIGRLDRILED
jgi:ABC-type transporter Mla subunit MlaD